jgi:hypothetical protein
VPVIGFLGSQPASAFAPRIEARTAEIARRAVYRPGDVGKNQLGNENP